MEDICTTITLKNITCEIAKQCPTLDGIDYNYLYKCNLNDNSTYFLFIGFILLLIFFYILYYSSEYYLALPLQRLVVYFNIDSQIAGVTILPFANGAPDFFTSLASGNIDDPETGLNLVLGSILGSGMFTTCLVFAIGLLVAKPRIKTELELTGTINNNKIETLGFNDKKVLAWIEPPKGFLVNLLVYSFGLTLLFILAWSRKVSILYASALILSYLIYLSFVIWPRLKIFNFINKCKVKSNTDNDIQHTNISKDDKLALEEFEPKLKDNKEIPKIILSNPEIVIEDINESQNQNDNKWLSINELNEGTSKQQRQLLEKESKIKDSSNLKLNNVNVKQKDKGITIPMITISLPSENNTIHERNLTANHLNLRKDSKDNINKNISDINTILPTIDEINTKLLKHGIQIEKNLPFFYPKNIFKIFYYNKTIHSIINLNTTLFYRIYSIIQLPVTLPLRLCILPSFTDWILCKDDEEFNYDLAIDSTNNQIELNQQQKKSSSFYSQFNNELSNLDKEGKELNILSVNSLRFLHRLLSSSPNSILAYRITLIWLCPCSIILLFYTTPLFTSKAILEPIPNLVLALIIGIILGILLFILTIPLTFISNYYRMKLYSYLCLNYPDKEHNNSIRLSYYSTSPNLSIPSPSSNLLSLNNERVSYHLDSHDIIIEEVLPHPHLERQRSWVSTFSVIDHKSQPTSINYPKWKTGFHHLYNFISSQSTIPLKRWIYYSILIEWLITCFGIALTIILISKISDLLISLLTYIAALFNIKTGFMGMTLLAWGNSISDLVIGASMAHSGLPSILLASAIAGPIFNLFVTMGSTLFEIIIQLNQGPLYVFKIESISLGNAVAFLFIFINILFILLFTWILPTLQTWFYNGDGLKSVILFPKVLPWLQLVWYITFIFTIACVEFL